MLQILTITGPIYLIIGAGFLAVRLGLFFKADMRVLGRFVVNFCVPAMLFNALSQRKLDEVLNATYLAAYALGSLTVLLAALFWARRLRGKAMPLAALFALGMSASNSALIGYPIVSQVLGPPAAVALALTMLVENLLMLPLALALADSGAESGPRGWKNALQQVLQGLLKNPMIVAIVAGFSCSLFDLAVPEVPARAVQIVATAASPVSLFVIGGSLVGLHLEGLRLDLARVALGKLVAHPLAVFGALWLLPPVDPVLRVAAVAFAGMPMLSMYPVLAQKYHHEGFCAAALLVTTMASFLTISALLWFLQRS